jgi:hypothetical protein
MRIEKRTFLRKESDLSLELDWKSVGQGTSVEAVPQRSSHGWIASKS